MLGLEVETTHIVKKISKSNVVFADASRSMSTQELERQKGQGDYDLSMSIQSFKNSQNSRNFEQ